VNICNLMPLSSREIQELESGDANIKSNWDNSRWYPGDTVALNCVYAFASTAQVENYVKGSFLYEEHAISLLRRRFLSINWNIECKKLGDAATRPITPWVMLLSKRISEIANHRGVTPRLIPKPGCAVTLKWKNTSGLRVYND
jgi:hypothetical protein